MSTSREGYFIYKTFGDVWYFCLAVLVVVIEEEEKDLVDGERRRKKETSEIYSS